MARGLRAKGREATRPLRRTCGEPTLDLLAMVRGVMGHRMADVGRCSVGVLLVASLAPAGSVAVAQQPTSAVFVETFDGDWRDRWSSQSLGRRPTLFAIASDDGNAVLRATADRSASALIRRVRVPVTPAVALRWRWRVALPLEGNERERERAGDDYAARVFVLFGSQRLDRNTRALLYVWAAHEAAGATYRSPYVEQVVTIVLQTGAGEGWMREERNLLADYRRAFGEEPPPVSAIAVMTDADDTGARAVAEFDDIAIVRR